MDLSIHGDGPYGSHLLASLEDGEALLVERNALLTASGAYRHEVVSGSKSGKRWLLKLYGQDLLHNVYRSMAPGTCFRFVPAGGFSLGILHYQPEEPLYLHPAAHFAHPAHLTLTPGRITFKTLVNGSPLLSVGGDRGNLVYQAAGTIIRHELVAESPIRVDEDALLALSGHIEVQPIAKSSVKETLTSGEGFLSQLTGEGTVYLQSRKASDFAGKSGNGWLSGWLAG
ncbi:AIM24 family protein [Lewinella sp. IMCC34191]|uniref:AIM24 family protein n=1 Tax=Lewinella sp. IMCC34191 TaxID=2259172 RepID=UPI00130017CC|nr:AIM24 family protein [Lewinella sp. IMCC34191]